MLIRRVLFACLNWTLAATLTALGVLLIGIVLAIADVETRPSSFMLLPFWTFVTLVAAFDSSKCGHGFVGAWVCGVRVDSAKNPLLSFLGTFVRASALMLIVSLFLDPLFHSFSDEATMSKAGWITYATIVLLLPASLVYSRGYVGLHDLLLTTRIVPNSSQHHRPTIRPGKLLIASCLIAMFASIAFYEFATGIGWLNRMKWEFEDFSPMIKRAAKRAYSDNSDVSHEIMNAVQAQIRDAGYRVTGLGFQRVASGLSKGTPRAQALVVTNDLLMSSTRMMSLSIEVQKALASNNVIGEGPIVVRIARRASFALMATQRNHDYVVADGRSKSVATGFEYGLPVAMCCGVEELYLTGE